MAAGGSGCTSSAGGGGGGGRGVNPRRSGRCVCICVRCVRGGEEGGGTGSDREAGAGVALVPLGDLPEPPPRREPRRTPPPPASRASGGFFPHGQEGVWTGAPREGPGGRAAPLTLCVLSVFLSQGPVSLCAAAGGTIRA